MVRAWIHGTFVLEGIGLGLDMLTESRGGDAIRLCVTGHFGSSGVRAVFYNAALG
jgi:hypothetical protein